MCFRRGFPVIKVFLKVAVETNILEVQWLYPYSSTRQ